MHAIDVVAPAAVLALPRLRVGTRASPLALHQTRLFMQLVGQRHPPLLSNPGLEEYAVQTLGDRIQDRRLADLGGKGLFAKDLHEALLDGRIDCAVHSLKDLETELPDGIVLACTLKREDPRDALILGPGCSEPDPADPWGTLPQGALVATASVRRQSQLLHRRPDLRVTIIRGNVQTRLGKVRSGENGMAASLLAVAGLRRLGLVHEAAVILAPEVMLPAAGQGIIGITVRRDDAVLRDLLAGVEDADARIAATAERAMLAALDGSCRTPIGSYARLSPDGTLCLSGLVARADGGFLIRRDLCGDAADAARIGKELGDWLRMASPADVFS
jgi:hydroxymethylbilane synthase